MMKKFFALSLVAVALSGCNSDCTFTESVQIDSKPAGAEVFVGGENVGTTPMCIDLNKSVPHQVVLKKAGYKDETFSLATVASDPFIKFGPLVDLGYYKELTPDLIEGKMLPDFLPATPGDDKFGGLTAAVIKTDQLKKDGKITPEDHIVMVQSVMEFYAPGLQAEVSEELVNEAEFQKTLEETNAQTDQKKVAPHKKK